MQVVQIRTGKNCSPSKSQKYFNDRTKQGANEVTIHTSYASLDGSFVDYTVLQPQ